MVDVPDGERRAVRVRASSNKKTSLQHYEEMRRAARVERAVVLVEMRDGTFQILGQGSSPQQMIEMVAVAANAMISLDKSQKEIRPTPHIEPGARGINTGTAMPPTLRKVTQAPDGTLVAPNGEGFISCGECNHPHFFLSHEVPDVFLGQVIKRFICTHCMNEVELGRIVHAGGTA